MTVIIDKFKPCVIFEYNGTKIKINLSSENPYQTEETILWLITKEESFKSSLKQFLRDYKINKIIE
jgi:hypothetical protein